METWEEMWVKQMGGDLSLPGDATRFTFRCGFEYGEAAAAARLAPVIEAAMYATLALFCLEDLPEHVEHRLSRLRFHLYAAGYITEEDVKRLSGGLLPGEPTNPECDPEGDPASFGPPSPEVIGRDLENK